MLLPNTVLLLKYKQRRCQLRCAFRRRKGDEEEIAVQHKRPAIVKNSSLPIPFSPTPLTFHEELVYFVSTSASAAAASIRCRRESERLCVLRATALLPNSYRRSIATGNCRFCFSKNADSRTRESWQRTLYPSFEQRSMSGDSRRGFREDT